MVSFFENVISFMLDNIFTLLNVFLSVLIYRLIRHLFKKLDIKNYVYEGEDERLDKVEIVWFSEQDMSSNDNIYRFKDKISSLLVFINKNDISFIDNLRMLIFFYATRNRNANKLPDFLIKKYVFPQLTLIKYNKIKY